MKLSNPCHMLRTVATVGGSWVPHGLPMRGIWVGLAPDYRTTTSVSKSPSSQDLKASRCLVSAKSIAKLHWKHCDYSCFLIGKDVWSFYK